MGRSSLLVLLLLVGCRAAPLAPAPEAFSQNQPNEVPPQLKIAALEASLEADALVLKATVYHPGDWTAQAFLDTDADINTGRQLAGHGLERVARIVEADANGTFPLRNPNGGDGGPSSGGWGPVVGYGHVVRDDVTLQVVLPYDALADSDGVALRFQISLSDGSFDFVDATVTPSIGYEVPWPRPRSFETAYSADSIYCELRVFADPSKILGRGPGEWWFSVGVVCEEFPGYQIFDVQVWPGRADVHLPDLGENTGTFPLLGSVPLVIAPTSIRFAFPRAWSPETQSAPSWSSCLILGLYPDGSEVPGVFIEDIPSRRDAPLSTAVPSRTPIRRW